MKKFWSILGIFGGLFLASIVFGAQTLLSPSNIATTTNSGIIVSTSTIQGYLNTGILNATSSIITNAATSSSFNTNTLTVYGASSTITNLYISSLSVGTTSAATKASFVANGFVSGAATTSVDIDTTSTTQGGCITMKVAGTKGYAHLYIKDSAGTLSLIIEIGSCQ